MTANPPKIEITPELELDRASALPRRALCRGSRRAEAGLPEMENEFSKEGQRLHAILAGEKDIDWSALSLDDAELIGRVVRLRDEHVAEHLGAVEIPEANIRRESKKIYVYDQIRPLCSGHFDWACWVSIDGVLTAFVWDYKLVGREPRTPAERELQLRPYALYMHQEHGAEVVYAGIIQPWAPREHQVTVACFTKADGAFDMALEELRTLDDETSHPYAERTPSAEACQYCKARGTTRCPESTAAANAAIEVVTGKGPITKEEALAKVENADKRQIADAMGRMKLFESVAEAIKARAKRELDADPQAFQDYPDANGKVLTLKPGNTQREVTDSAAAYDKLYSPIFQAAFNKALEGLEEKQPRFSTERIATRFARRKCHAFQNDYLASCNISITGLEKAYRKATGCNAKDAKAELNDLLGDLIEQKQNKPSLVAVPTLEDKK